MDYFQKYSSFTDLFVIPLNAQKINLLTRYFHFLMEEAMPRGFIGKAAEETIWVRHILDSLLILQKKEVCEILLNSELIIDLGSGAGLPGIPLSILLPERKFFLIDSMKKRIDFLEKIKQELNLQNVDLLFKRIEEIEYTDIAVLKDTSKKVVLFRAFLKPLVSLEMALHVLTKNSKVLYWRSRRFDVSDTFDKENNSFFSQVNARVEESGFKILQFYNLVCPEELHLRGVYLIDYTGRLNDKYPRRWNKIKKDQLINKIE
ncbi:MAG: 16S rRNA (guanine(527)-N(7))-methyltransferase RsmG [Spirochaetia bacterium]|nr:16S rRNA (guanine(527)-N(7))-methyltransferase RsmG [Spirochaetia bacterium]